MRNFFVFILGVAIGIGIALVVTSFLTNSADDSPASTTFSHDRDAGDIRTWQIAELSGGGNGEALFAVVREKHESRMPNQAERIDVLPLTLGESRGEIIIGGVMGGEIPSAKVAVQTLDVRDWAAVSVEDGLPLRMVVRISWGGASPLAWEKSEILAGNRFAGSSEVRSPKWTNGEMHLCNVFTVSDEETSKYSVFLRRGD